MSRFLFDSRGTPGCIFCRTQLVPKTIKTKIPQRPALSKMAAGPAAASAAASLAERTTAADSSAELKGRINHSVCKWCYPSVKLEDLCVAGKAMGLQSIELLGPEDWPTLRKHGLTCAMA